jgi:hypothetical protein
MARTYLVTGVALKDGTIRLDRAGDLPEGRVRVIVELDDAAKDRSLFEITPVPSSRTARQVIDDIGDLRDEWDLQK